MQKQLDRKLDEYKYANEFKAYLNSDRRRKRRLEEDDEKKLQPPKMKRLPEDDTLYDKFNKEYHTRYIRPITYRFNEDSYMKYQIDFSESIFPLGAAPVMDLYDWKVVFLQKNLRKGIDLEKLGRSAYFDAESASENFEALLEKNQDVKTTSRKLNKKKLTKKQQKKRKH